MYVTVKLPKEKVKGLREIKARLMLAGEINATDSEALGRAIDVANRHEDELIGSMELKRSHVDKIVRKAVELMHKGYDLGTAPYYKNRGELYDRAY